MKSKWFLLFLVLVIVFTSCQRSRKIYQQPQSHNLISVGQNIPSNTQMNHGQQNNATAEPEDSISDSPNNATQQNTPDSQNSSGNSDGQKPSDSPTQVQNPTEILLDHEQKNPLDEENLINFIQINNLADSMKKKAKDDNAIVLSVANNLWKYFKYSDMLLDIKVADIDNDLLDEIIFLYRDETDPENQSILSFIRWEGGRLAEFGSLQVFDCFYSQLTISDLITGGSPEICVMDDGWEYPEYMVFSFENNGWESIDLYALGVKGIHQFVDFSDNTVSIGHRVTTGVYGGSIYQWDGNQFVEIDKNFYDDRKLYKLDYQPITNYDDEVPELNGDKVIVSDVYEFISVLGSNRTIQMKPGVYDFDKLKYEINSPHVAWSNTEEGYFRGLKVKDVENISIEAVEAGTVEIVTRDTDSVVMSFENSKNVTLRNLMIGHGIEEYGPGCSTEVIKFEACTDVKMQQCTLYGCGAYGFTANNCLGLKLTDSVIEECSYGAAIVQSSENIELDHCILRNNEGYTLLDFMSSSDIRIKNTLIENNRFTHYMQQNNCTVELTNITYQNNNFSEDMQYNGEPDSPERWKTMAEPVFVENKIPLHTVSLKNEYTLFYPVFSATLPSSLIYDQQASFQEFLLEIAKQIDFSNYIVEDKELHISIKVICNQEQQYIYEIIYLDTEEYQKSSLLSKENFDQMTELTGLQIPVTIIHPDEINQLGKPGSYDIFIERISYTGYKYLNLDAVYPGNRIIRQPIGYYRKWYEPDRAYSIQLPEAFSNNLLLFNHDEGLILIDKQNNILAFLKGTWGAWCQFTLQYAYRLKEGSLRELAVIGCYREENTDLFALYDDEKIYKTNLLTLDTVEKSLLDWTIIPSTPSLNHDSYSPVCLQVNSKTGITREYFPSEDKWTLIDYEIPQSYRIDKKGERSIIVNNGSQYGILLVNPGGSEHFIDRDNDGKLFGREIIDVQYIRRPGPMSLHIEPLVLFDDFSYMILDISEEY